MAPPYTPGTRIHSLVHISGSGFDKSVRPSCCDLGRVSTLAANIAVPKSVTFNPMTLSIVQPDSKEAQEKLTEKTKLGSSSDGSLDPFRTPQRNAVLGKTRERDIETSSKGEPTASATTNLRKRPRSHGLLEDSEILETDTLSRAKVPKIEDGESQPPANQQFSPNVQSIRKVCPPTILVVSPNNSDLRQHQNQYASTPTAVWQHQKSSIPLPTAVPAVPSYVTAIPTNGFSKAMIVPASSTPTVILSSSSSSTNCKGHRILPATVSCSASLQQQPLQYQLDQAIVTNALDSLLQEARELKQENTNLARKLSLFQQLFRDKERLTYVVKSIGITVA